MTSQQHVIAQESLRSTDQADRPAAAGRPARSKRRRLTAGIAAGTMLFLAPVTTALAVGGVSAGPAPTVATAASTTQLTTPRTGSIIL